jgi:outer membrane receptor protein involved in Fe transport
VLGFALSSPGFAQTAPAAALSPATLAKYDTNKNGVLDADEAARMQADQAAPVSVAADKAATSDSGEVVELSPFQVNADDDHGYLASNTLSGTRLNSKLEDLGSSITVVTKQQMIDTAALDINDIFLYEANTEGTGNFTAFTVDRNGGVNDSVQSSPQTANRIRGLDSANTARGNFASNSSIPLDPYNIDSVEISRGPNSNIFGLGNTSGTVNFNQSQANTSRQSTSFTLRGDSYGGYRSSVDLNRPILRGKLGVRVSAVYQSTGYERKPSADITRRQQGTITYRPTPKTTFRGTYEAYNNYARRPNSVTPRDTVTYWRSVGSPTWDPTTWTAKVNGASVGVFTAGQDGTLPMGLYAQGTGFYNRPSIYVDNGAIQFWSVNRTGSVPTTGTFAGIPTPDNPNQNIRFLESGTDLQRLRGTLYPLYVTPSITDKSIYDWTSENFVAPNYLKNKADIYTLEAEHIFLETRHQLLAGRLGWYREDTDSYSRNFIGGTNAVLYVDVNEKLLDGSPNPYFKRPYIAASEPTLFKSPNVNDIQSADLAYQLTPSKMPRWLSWIGQQKVATHWETRRIDTATYRYRDSIVDDHPWINLQNRTGVTAARAYYKYYVGDNQGQNVDYAPPAVYSLGGTYPFTWYNAKTLQWVNEPATIAEAGITPSNRTRREIRTASITTQNFFLDDRLVTTFGWRKDKNRSRDSSGAVVDPTTGFLDYSPLNNWGVWNEKQGRTKTAGAVVKPFSWLNLSYNQADSFQPANTAYNLYGEILPNPTGKGKDYGVTINLGRQLSVRIGKYETRQKNARLGDAGSVATRAIQLDTARVNNGSIPYNFETWATNLANARFTAQGVTPSAAQLSSAVAKIMGLPDGFLDQAIGHSIAETGDTISKGYELELNYNPTNSWRTKVTAAETQAIDDNLSPKLQQYIESRLPIWQAAKDDNNVSWWTLNNGGIPQNFYTNSISAPLKLAIANQGKPRSQVREWRFNALTNYTFTEGRLKNLSVGGAVRWEDKAAIGFLGAAPDADGIVRSLDRNKPVYDDARFYFDLSAGYNLRLYQNKIRTRIQLNVRNAFENGRLQAIAVNPDGSPYAYRIIDPRQFILTTTFDF